MARRRGAAVALDAVDRVYLRRAYELAERGRGDTAPNPCVGAVLVRGTRTLGEGHHRRRGGPHAEVEALHAVAPEHRAALRGATAYVSLEPCNHHGATPPCSDALVAAGVERVVIGARDPHPRGASLERLREAGIDVDLAGDREAAALVEDFGVWLHGERPYVRLKLAASLDGYVAPKRGSYWLSGAEARDFVRELRGAYDAVLVGAGTVRVDDPQLTVRPPRSRARPYLRIVACERAIVSPAARVFAPVEGYAPTIVLAPAGARSVFAALENVAEVLYVGGEDALRLDLGDALRALRARGVAGLVCEGGPTLARALLAAGVVDRLDWLLAPQLLAAEGAVPALPLGGPGLGGQVRFDRVERLGDDVLVSSRLKEKA